MRTVRFASLLLTSLVFGSFAAGCAIKPDDSDRFREAIPTQEQVALRIPGAEAASTGSVGKASLRIKTDPGSGTLTGADSTARYYRFTRDMTNAVDFGTAVILGSVWAIVHTTPTSIDDKTAVWGPGAA